jgi:excisionase family DNA binding protein
MEERRAADLRSNDNDLLTVAPAARVLERSEGFVRQAANDGRLPVMRTSSGVRVFRRADLDHFKTTR